MDALEGRGQRLGVPHVSLHHLGGRGGAGGELGRPAAHAAHAPAGVLETAQKASAHVAAGAGEQQQRIGGRVAVRGHETQGNLAGAAHDGDREAAMRVAVVGAGLAGLLAARELVAGGHEVVVLEKSRGVGGRLASRRVGEAVVNHGSPALAAPPGSALRAAIDAQPAALRETPDGLVDPAGATRLPKLLAAGLDVRRGVRVVALREGSAGIELGDEQGNTHGVVDAVIVTAPAPQAADLLARSPEAGDRVDALRGLAYDPAVMVLLGVLTDRGHAAAPTPVGAMADVRLEASKGREAHEGVDAVVARLDPDRSGALLDASDEAVLADALPALAGRLGPAFARPEWAQVKRWRYAVPRGRLDDARVNPPGARVLVAGDALTGASFGGHDHHRVAACGVAAARRLAATAQAVAR